MKQEVIIPGLKEESSLKESLVSKTREFVKFRQLAFTNDSAREWVNNVLQLLFVYLIVCFFEKKVDK